MAHLGDDVSAFVDGQLSPRAAKAAERHLSHCAACRGVVDLHQQTKARMQLGTRRPDVPLSLLQTLSNLPDEAPAAGPLPRRRRWWARLGRSRGLGAGVVVVGASFAVVATAYLAGARPAEADPVAPSFDSYAADFADGYGTAQDTMTVAAMSRLDSNGFPCHERLAGTLERVDGRWHEGSGTIAVTYSDGTHRLRLYEQNGALDTSTVTGFSADVWDEHRVWVRSGSPAVVTWDSDGVVYTVVSDVDRDTLVQAVSELPSAAHPQSRLDRLEDGVERMSAWLGAA
ncbi:hypothetical protein ASD11_10510 [Aeromicrobium sp. Root495]|uniref:anti-sigma factor family protein n=1 Tax=Aeromicrobium sp. Root495 TaxID=1736550 RepID=UPI0006FB5484|nr:zf-HC2 domain-containing protein [Aeromicrobium sp. Root495]KQY59929.1 hypothetical protein ASD11_10510 [Aeromicrobium sp. Root495]